MRGEQERRPQKDFENELKKVNPSVQIVGIYTGRHNAIKVCCLKCNNIWEATEGSLLRKDCNRSADNNGCPRCAKSKMETPRKKSLMLKPEKFLILL